MDAIHINELKPQELKQVIAEKPLILIPLGTTEWHAAHLPLGVDSLLSQATCDALSERTGVPVAPLVSFGICRNLDPENGYFGTVDSIRVETLAGLLSDLFQGYAKLGFQKAVLMSGHFETDHWKAIQQAVAGAADIQVHVLSADDFTGHLIEESADPTETWPFATDHAAEWETSMMLHFYPDLVDMEQAPETIELRMPGIPVYLHKRFPRRASKEYGKKLAQASIENGVKKIKELLKI